VRQTPVARPFDAAIAFSHGGPDGIQHCMWREWLHQVTAGPQPIGLLPERICPLRSHQNDRPTQSAMRDFGKKVYAVMPPGIFRSVSTHPSLSDGAAAKNSSAENKSRQQIRWPSATVQCVSDEHVVVDDMNDIHIAHCFLLTNCSGS